MEQCHETEDDTPETDAAFAELVSTLFDTYWSVVRDRGLDSWSPLPALVALEAEYLNRWYAWGELDERSAKDRAAAVATVRDYIVWRHRQQASMN